ncbi:hypothetical protein ACERII_01430 [Evansella sp. AB-rgal1]|uniref:hypothetical protein n=1 Tax=Evansella sp. AB-rgal1 TaxID=3242696 RepID=UPI00359EB18E
MNTLKENHGYALITVLLITVIFSLISLGFLAQSISSMKQSTKVETKSQSIELAEMGATYFQYAVKDATHVLLAEVMEQVEATFYANPMQSSEYFTSLGITLLKDSLASEFSEPISIPIKDIPNASFTIDILTPTADLSDKKIVINADSLGKKDNDESKIQASLTINFDDFISLHQTEEQGVPKPTINKIDVPTSTSMCQPGIVNYSGKECLQINNVHYGNNINDVKFENSKVKVQGSLTIDGNMNNPITSSTLYVEQSLNFKRTVTFNNTKLFVGGITDFDESVRFNNHSTLHFTDDVDFKFNYDLSASQMYAGKKAFFKKPSKIENESQVYVEGFADVDETMNISGNSKVYFGSADIKKNFTVDNSTFSIGDVSTDLTNFHETVDIRNNSEVFISGNTYFKKNFNLSGSTIFIDGDADFDETMDFSNNSKMCVNGHFYNKHNRNINLNGNSKIYAKTANDPKVNTTDINEQCNFGSGSSNSMNWNNPSITSDFNYSY